MTPVDHPLLPSDAPRKEDPGPESSWNVRHEVNNRQPVFSLSTELLRYIVEYLPECHSHHGQFRSEYFPAFTLSHTCRRWRNITLAIPTAWRALPYRNTYWIEECSRRAMDTPLELIVHSPDFDKRNIYNLAPFIQRAGWLKFSGSSRSVGVDFERNHALLTLLTVDFPRLRWLELALDVAGVLPNDIFSGNPLPRLASLQLKSCDVMRAPHVLQGPMLTTINIHSSTLWADIDSMITAVRGMSALERFCINFSHFIDDLTLTPSSIHPSRCVRMARMSLLKIYGPTRHGAALLQYLMLPLTCNISLTNAGWAESASATDIGGWKNIRDSLNAHLANVPAAVIPSSEVKLRARIKEVSLAIFCKLPKVFVDPVTAQPVGDATDDYNHPAVSIIVEILFDNDEDDDEDNTQTQELLQSIPLVAQSEFLDEMPWFYD